VVSRCAFQIQPAPLRFGGIAAVAAVGVASPPPPPKKAQERLGFCGEGGEKTSDGGGGGGCSSSSGGGSVGLTARSSLAPLLPALFIFAVSASTYLGVRTYPSFAMFSNLLLEGGASNHWVVTSPLRFDVNAGSSSLARYYGPHVAVEVLDTNLPSLRNLQVNLAPLLPPAVLAALAAANVTVGLYELNSVDP
jgi:hypothetical protein